MPFDGLITLLQNLIAQFRAPEEKSLFDLVRSVAMAFASGADPALFLLGSDPGEYFDDRAGTGWNLSFDELDSGLRLTDVTRAVEGGGNPPTVLTRLEISRVEVEDPGIQGGQPLTVPLTASHRVAFAAVGPARFSQLDAHPYYRLATAIERSYLLVYAYLIAADGSVSALAAEDALSDNLLERIEQGSLQNQQATSTILLVAVELVFCQPKKDFDPFGGAEMARCYPLVSCWSSRPLDQIHCEIDFVRPRYSDHPMSHGSGQIYVSFYTDRNSEQEIGVIDVAPFPNWEVLFDHYRLDGQGSAEFAAVSTLGERVDPDTRMIRVLHPGFQDPVTTTSVPEHVELIPTPVKKLARQGRFDNVHLAPAMEYQGERAFMAPICQHDCLHMHWRWSSGYWKIQSYGWSPEWPGSGGPCRGKGTPLVPPNQVVTVAPLSDEAGIRYKATAHRVDFGGRRPSERWHVFCHHGFGYVTDFAMDWAFIFYPGDIGGFYYGLRYMHDEQGTPVTRIVETAFPQLEVL